MEQKNLHLARKIVIVSAVLSAIFLGSTYTYVLLQSKNEITKFTLETLETKVEKEKERIETTIDNIRSTVLFLANTPPIQGMIRANRNDGFDEDGNSTREEWEDRLATIFTAELNARTYLDHLRYINETGQEIVRVNDTSTGAVIVAKDQLQNKNDRTYFLEAAEMNSGSVYVSGASLNKEGEPAIISIPHKPVIRYAVPIFDESNNDFKGILIANVLVDELIESEKLSRVNEDAELYIFDDEGYFIVHSDSNKEWGSIRDLDTGANISTEFNNINISTFQKSFGSLMTDEDIFVFSKIITDINNTNDGWVILQKIDTPSLFGPINGIIKTGTIIATVTFIILLLMFILSVRIILKPVKNKV